MKKFTVLLALVFGFGQLFASNNSPVGSEQQLRNEVAILLKSPEIVVKEELKANIEFTLNVKGEIVVLNVDSKEELVVNYVKSRLNYKKIASNTSKNKNRIFKLILKIKKPKEA
ncbi:hypothetical protein [Aquimarina mytili]|uniref:Uncharacterized protein n=1 Tax=Aquimarina mytili TaxID=874423 RepID=A0A937D956_9FLAO|nr:hypothetical protein [Aquimarina mytili]MBL0682168.1 hypothetical protein [Aquimarina mytili]